jgi:hypothetical protein
MNGIGEHAGYYRGYLTDDRSLVPMTIVLATGARCGCSSISSASSGPFLARRRQ